MISFFSDEHLDFFISKESKMEKQIDSYIDNITEDISRDILILSGDISHYNRMTKMYLQKMSERFNDVVFVHGNHDLYLVNETQAKKYNYDSFQRLDEIREFTKTIKNLHLLEGNVISINGLKIGGLSNWYDLPTDGYITQWNQVLNDSNYIMEGKKPIKYNYGYYSESFSAFDTQRFRKEIEKQWDRLEDIDILVTHICPSIIPDEILGRFVNDRNNIFYMTDDFDRVKNTGAKIVIYGHNHGCNEWTKDNVKFFTNASGYPHENNNLKIKEINV